MRAEALAAAQWWADRLALGYVRHDMGDPQINAIMNRSPSAVRYTPSNSPPSGMRWPKRSTRRSMRVAAAPSRFGSTTRFDYQPDWVLIEAAQRAGIDLEPGGLPLLPVKTGTRVAPGLVSVTEGDAQRDEPVVVWEAGTPGRSSAGRTET
jgi:hypothetical protein